MFASMFSATSLSSSSTECLFFAASINDETIIYIYMVKFTNFIKFWIVQCNVQGHYYHLFCILTGCHFDYGQFRDCCNTRDCPFGTKSILLVQNSKNHPDHKKILIVMLQLGTQPHLQQMFFLHRSNLSLEMLLARILYLASDEKENTTIRK